MFAGRSAAAIEWPHIVRGQALGVPEADRGHGVDARSGSNWWRRQWGSGTEHLRVEAPELASIADPVSAISTAANEARAEPGQRSRGADQAIES